MNGRMPTRLSFGLLLVLVSLVGFFATGKPAHADPHALFYTAIGQRQLFFNVLAALDQADYVEPPGNGTFGRDSLLTKLENASANPDLTLPQKVAETKTDLSSVLTRGITLQGNDLWTTYLAFQLAREVDQANNSDELSRLFCQHSLGRKNCENEGADSPEEIAALDRAFIYNPAKRNAIAASEAARVLRSNTDIGSDYQGHLSDLVVDEKKTIAADVPVPFDSGIASLNAKAKAANDLNKQNALARLATGAELILQTTRVNNRALDNIEADDTKGTVQLTTVQDEAGSDRAARYAATLAHLVDLPLQFEGVALEAAASTSQYLAQTETDGAIADVEVTTQRKNGAILGRSPKVVTPAHVKVALSDHALNAVVQNEANPLYADLLAERDAGDISAVDRVADAATPPSSGLSNFNNPTLPSVAGAETTTPNTLGRVLHAVDIGDVGTANSSDPEHHADRQASLPIDVNLRGFHHEPGPVHLFEAASIIDPDIGCGCSASRALNSHGRSILAAINTLARR